MELLLAIGFWPILVFTVWALVLFPIVEFERTGYAFLTVLVGAGLLQYFGYYDFAGLIHNPFALLTWVGAYVIVGIGYSLLRWNWFCGKWRQAYDECEVGGYGQRALWDTKPSAMRSKSRITTWMMFWPWSAFWWFFSDFITEAFEWIYRNFASVYESIAQRHFKGLVAPPEPQRANKV